MPVRSTQDLKHATIKTATVGAAVTNGYGVKHSSEGVITNVSAGEQPAGIALETGVTGRPAQFALLSGPCIIPVKVSATGAATRDGWAIATADGFTDAVALGGGTVAKNIAGKFYDSGVAGDIVGLVPAPFTGVSA